MSKREESKERNVRRKKSTMQESKLKKEHNAKGELKRVANHQNNYNKLSVSEKCVVSTLVVLIDLFFFHTIRYLSASTSDAFHSFSIF
jgi:hypothetical protein